MLSILFRATRLQNHISSEVLNPPALFEPDSALNVTLLAVFLSFLYLSGICVFGQIDGLTRPLEDSAVGWEGRR